MALAAVTSGTGVLQRGRRPGTDAMAHDGMRRIAAAAALASNSARRLAESGSNLDRRDRRASRDLLPLSKAHGALPVRG
jgi:hypothetical protein